MLAHGIVSLRCVWLPPTVQRRACKADMHDIRKAQHCDIFLRFPMKLYAVLNPPFLHNSVGL